MTFTVPAVAIAQEAIEFIAITHADAAHKRLSVLLGDGPSVIAIDTDGMDADVLELAESAARRAHDRLDRLLLGSAEAAHKRIARLLGQQYVSPTPDSGEAEEAKSDAERALTGVQARLAKLLSPSAPSPDFAA